MKFDICKAVSEHKVIAILRGVDKDRVVETAQALYDGGIRLLEITFAQHSPTCIEDTRFAIGAVREQFGDKMAVGAGTVLTKEQAAAAHEGGAQFILSAVTDPSVIACANELGMATVPGAMTPSEIQLGYSSGGDLIKVFPAGDMGLSYIKSVRAPLSHIPMLAVGGVDHNNLSDFLAVGVVGVGIGSNLADPRLIVQGDFAEITRRARLYTAR
ncbi:bifunctional 4-hydroxy-2-oxoglutarate aldolase/2-dehydro-3-deoxy-phosphogluconate aldolase [Oscillospiraceae bacterium MB08-C2-2]|nr:bifunctional 4-hydroxy-2-oxoglutarate aldolase/2-dehydro-3-deoxy-phosphogluconate aldolase [Oscillospiraceae bacterium MB08-C2-2]